MTDAPVAAPQPSNVEAEYLLVAGVLFESSRTDQAADLVTGEDFADPFFGRVFDLIVREHGKGAPLNALTIRPFLEGDAGYEAMGGPTFLKSITGLAAAVVNTRDAATQIEGLARRRRLIAALTEAITQVGDSNHALGDIVQDVDGAMAEVTGAGSSLREMSAAQALGALMKMADAPKRSIRSGIAPIDEVLGGMRPKQLVIGAGRPGMGKTAAALSHAIGAARAGHGVIYVSLEMGAEDLTARMAADMSYDTATRVAYADINSDHPSRKAFDAMSRAQIELEKLPLHIVDAGSMTLGRLEMIIRRYKRRLAARGQSLDMVIVDYLQLLRTDTRRNSNYETVSEISMRLKAMAKDHDVCVFALAQLSREVEKRPDKRPQLSDLRDSGQIEQDADAVMFFYRYEYYIRQTKPAEHDPGYPAWRELLAANENIIEFICPKVRNGRTGASTGFFYGAYQAVR